MSLFQALQRRYDAGQPVKLAMIGAGKFGSMFLAQALKLKALQIVAISDLNPQHARSNLMHVGWPEDALSSQRIQRLFLLHPISIL